MARLVPFPDGRPAVRDPDPQDNRIPIGPTDV
ncbi:hypothetical protein LMG6103_03556 [Achromobacter piechaudii]|nr:hypothetical protein LMG6103_03556 [Achromobacter piechaudii]